MPKGIPNKRYTAEFKQQVIETMYREKLGYVETAERFGIRHKRVQDWERIYLTDGPKGFSIERRGRGNTGVYDSYQRKWKKICWQKYNGCEQKTTT